MKNRSFDLVELLDPTSIGELLSGKKPNLPHQHLIFPNPVYFQLVISNFCKATKLAFGEDVPVKGNVYFAENPELRTNYKQTFTQNYLVAYIAGILMKLI